MGPPPFSHTCKTVPETGEQFSMPIGQSFPAQAGNLFLSRTLYARCKFSLTLVGLAFINQGGN